MKTVLTFILLFNFSLGFSYDWTRIGLDSIKANHILFEYDYGNYTLICTDDGVCAVNPISGEWEHFTYGSLPVWEAVGYDENNALLIMGNGSYSDGIYKFNITTNTFEVVDFIFKPTFIKYYAANNTYYVGTHEWGLRSSTDGIAWTSVPYFQNKECTAMAFYDEYIVVSQENNSSATYFSSNGGEDWSQSSSSIPFHDLAFDNNGILYGVSKSLEYGLFISNDYGQTWDIEHSVQNLNTVGIGMMEEVICGFHGGLAPNEGVAVYDTSQNNFTFLNEDLLDKNINMISYHPMIYCPNILVCTDLGVFYCCNYIASVNKFSITKNEISIFPNPSKDFIEIECLSNTKIEFYNVKGQIVKQILSTDIKTNIDISKLSIGIYYIILTQDKEQEVKKFIKL